MQGIFLHGSRPKSKKEVKEVVDAAQGPKDPAAAHNHDLYCITVEATSFFGDEYDGSLANASPDDGPFSFVGPDPRNSRKFYGSIGFSRSKAKWLVE